MFITCSHLPLVRYLPPRLQYPAESYQPCDKSLSAQPISIRKAQPRKKNTHKPLRTWWISQTNTRPCLISIKSCCFDDRINITFQMFSLHDLHFVLCSRDWSRWIIGVFLSSHKYSLPDARCQMLSKWSSRAEEGGGVGLTCDGWVMGEYSRSLRASESETNHRPCNGPR